MTSRFVALLGCGLALAVACGSDDDSIKKVPDQEPGGAGGEAGAPPVSSGGSSTSPVAGAGGESDTGGSASAGTGAVPTDGGAGGALSAAGATSGGAGGEPSGPGSACEAGEYETGDGCDECPALPTPNDANALNCQDHTRSYFNTNDLILEVSFAQVPFHEPVAGETSVAWTSTDGLTDGSAVVRWTYSPVDEKFVFELPIEARYSVEWRLDGWAFADECGFLFSVTNLVIDYDGEAFKCGNPT